MSLPSFEDIMLPLLEYLSDKKEQRYTETMEYLTNFFSLSKNDLEIEKASGGNLFYNRIGWAKDYLTRAGLLEKKPGRFKISQRGIEILAKKPQRIDKQFLLQFTEFIPYVSSRKKSETDSHIEMLGEKSPDDLIDDGIEQINNILKTDLLERLRTVDPTFFERIIIDLVEKLGYGKGKHVGRVGDGGIDGEIPQDKLGLEMVYLQAKRHGSNISAHSIRDFIGALSLKKARKEIFITTSDFTTDAYEDVQRSEKNIVLINGSDLVNLMVEHNVGIRIKKSLNIKEIDNDYFDQ